MTFPNAALPPPPPVRHRRGDDATLLFLDPANAVAVIALSTDPLVPTRVPIEEVTLVLPTLSSEVAPAVAAALGACLPALDAILGAGGDSSPSLKPSLLPTVLQAVIADMQVRGLKDIDSAGKLITCFKANSCPRCRPLGHA